MPSNSLLVEKPKIFNSQWYKMKTNSQCLAFLKDKLLKWSLNRKNCCRLIFSSSTQLIYLSFQHRSHGKMTKHMLFIQVCKMLCEYCSYLAVAWREGSLAEHGETGGAVPGGAVVSDPACVLGFIGGVDSPSLQEEHHVSHLSDHRAVGQLQVILWVPITTTWHNGRTDVWCVCELYCCIVSEKYNEMTCAWNCLIKPNGSRHLKLSYPIMSQVKVTLLFRH